MQVPEILYSIQKSVGLVVPEVILFLGIIIFTGLSFFGNSGKKAIAPIFLTLLFSSLYFVSKQMNIETEAFAGMLRLSSFSSYFKMLIDVSAILCLVLYVADNKRDQRFTAEFFILILCIAFGCHLLVMSNHLLMIFISIEIISLCSYMLSGFSTEKKSSEGSLKYFLFGSVASAVMLFGLSLIYATTGTLTLSNDSLLTAALSQSALTTIALSFIFCGFLFKISAAPMHIWAPDVYESAPTAFVAFLSVAPKLAALALVTQFSLSLRIFHQSAIDWQAVLAGITLLTITVGNFGALFQKNLKRLMAYSSIAQSGFLLIGLVALLPQGIHFLIFYAAIYVVMNYLVFTYILSFEKHGMYTVDSVRGVGKTLFIPSVFVLIGLIALTGLPPTAGFTAKLFIFSALWESFELTGKNILLWLLIFGLLNTVVSLFYYLKIPYYSFLKSGETPRKQNILTIENLLGLILVLLLLLFFFAPGLLMGWINKVNFVF